MPNLVLNRIVGRADIQRRWLQAGVRPQYWQYIKEGRTVSVDYKGGKTSTQITQIYVDGRPQLTRALPISKPEGPRPRATPRAQYLGQGAEVQVVRSPGGVVQEIPRYPGEIDRSGLTGGLADLGRAEIQEGLPETRGLKAADIFAVARGRGQDVAQVTGAGPVFIPGKEKDQLVLTSKGIENIKIKEFLPGGGLGSGLAITQKSFEQRRAEKAVKEALALPPGAFIKELGRGVSDKTLGLAQKTIKGVFKLASAANIGQFVERNGKLVFAKPTEKEFIAGRSSLLQTEKQAKKLFNDIKVKGNLLKDPDVQAAATAGSLALASVTLPIIALRGLGVGIGALGGREAVKAAKRGDVAGTAAGVTIALAGATEIPEITRRAGLEILTRTKLVKEVKPETIFDPAVLKGKTSLPKTTGPEAALKEFKKANNKVSTATAETARLVSEGVKAGKTKRVKQEATIGLFVTPAGKGSPYFLRIPKLSKGALEFKLIPETIVPKSIQIQTRGVERIPPEILKAGKEATLKFQLEKGISQEGKAFITPRSEARFNKQIKDALKIKTTSELEAVIPAGTKIKAAEKTTIGKILGFEKVTRVKGEIVTIPERVVLGKRGKGNVLTKDVIKDIEKVGRDLERVRRAQTKEVAISRILAPSRRALPAVRTLRSSIVSRVFRTPTRIAQAPRRPVITERPGRTLTRITSTPRIPRVPTRTTKSFRQIIRTTPVRATTRTTPYRIPVRIITPPPPPPPVKIEKLLKTKEEKKPRVLARLFKYQPSVEAKALNIKGVSIPKILTGITTRKIRI